jgi:hypothetical protein
MWMTGGYARTSLQAGETLTEPGHRVVCECSLVAGRMDL